MGKDSGARTSTRNKPSKVQPKKQAKAKAKKIVKVTKATKVLASRPKKAQPVPAKILKKPAAAAKKTTKKAIPKKRATPTKDPQVKIAAAPKKPSGPKGYTAAQYQKFKQFKTKFGQYSNQQLKDLLKKNLQSMTGNKDDLIFKCADGATLGRIPRCPKCFGGRPKFDFQKGNYYCSGYRDDEEFKNCHSSFQLGQIKRDTWDN